MVKCLDATTGEVLWQLAVPQRSHGLPKEAHYGHQHLGVCSSPAVDDDRVYVVSSANEVLCLDIDGMSDGNDGPFQDEGQYMVGPGRRPIELGPQDADIIWSFDMVAEVDACPHDAASCSPLVHGNMVYAGTSNGVDGPHKKVVRPEAPSLVVLDKRTGELVATDGERIGTRMWHAQWSSPSTGKVGGKSLIFIGGGDGICYAFEAVTSAPSEPFHLTKVWSYDCNPPHYRNRDGQPIPYYDGDRRKRRGNTNDGTYLGPSQIIATPVFHQGRVYVAIGQDPAHGRGLGMLHCIDATRTGDITESGKIWSYDGIERSISSVTISDGLAYIPDIAGKLHCLKADTGECCWVHETVAETWGTPLLADGKIYLGNQRKFLILAAGRRPKVLFETRLGSPMYASAVAANGVVYVASQRQLWAVTTKP
jgi:outer membrane protein assembly factor BamB